MTLEHHTTRGKATVGPAPNASGRVHALGPAGVSETSSIPAAFLIVGKFTGETLCYTRPFS